MVILSSRAVLASLGICVGMFYFIFAISRISTSIFPYFFRKWLVKVRMMVALVLYLFPFSSVMLVMFLLPLPCFHKMVYG
jgi:Na+/melibiose symporter-like transporter